VLVCFGTGAIDLFSRFPRHQTTRYTIKISKRNSMALNIVRQLRLSQLVQKPDCSTTVCSAGVSVVKVAVETDVEEYVVVDDIEEEVLDVVPVLDVLVTDVSVKVVDELVELVDELVTVSVDEDVDDDDKEDDVLDVVVVSVVVVDDVDVMLELVVEVVTVVVDVDVVDVVVVVTVDVDVDVVDVVVVVTVDVAVLVAVLVPVVVTRICRVPNEIPTRWKTIKSVLDAPLAPRPLPSSLLNKASTSTVPMLSTGTWPPTATLATTVHVLPAVQEPTSGMGAMCCALTSATVKSRSIVNRTSIK